MFEYEIIDGEVTITGYNDQSVESIIIPETIEGYPVTKIDLYCFWFQKALTRLYIPKSITHMAYNALKGVNSIKYINNECVLNRATIINNRFIFIDDLCYTITHQIGNDYYCRGYYIIDGRILRKI